MLAAEKVKSRAERGEVWAGGSHLASKDDRKAKGLSWIWDRSSYAGARVFDATMKSITRSLTQDGVNNISTVFCGKITGRGHLCFLCEHFSSFHPRWWLYSQGFQKDIEGELFSALVSQGAGILLPVSQHPQHRCAKQ